MFQLRTLCAAFYLFCVFPLCSQAQDNKAPIRRLAPDFSLPSSDGKVLKLADLKGSVILLEFFQTGCANCQIVAPKLDSLYRKYKGQGLVVLAVSFDAPTGSVAERVRAVEPFIRQNNLSYPVLLGDRSILIHYIQKPGFSSPFVVFINRTGWIVAQVEEGPDHKACDIVFLENQVKALLK